MNGGGKVNSRDIAVMQKYFTGTAELDEIQMATADMNGDKKVKSRDIAAIQKKLIS